MASYASPSELQSFHGGDIPTDRAELALELASAAADDAAATLGATIEQQEDRTVTLDGTGGSQLLVPWPVDSISSVAIIEDDGDEDTLDGPGSSDVDYRWTREGVLERAGAAWPDRPRSVKVTLTHGLDPVPTSIKAVVLEAAEAAISNPSQLGSLNTDGTNVGLNAGGIRLSRDQIRRVLQAIR